MNAHIVYMCMHSKYDEFFLKRIEATPNILKRLETPFFLKI